MPRTIHLTALAVILGVATSLPAADFDTLMRMVPRDANTILMIDVEGILASDVAQQNSWGSRFSSKSADRPTYLPPEADKVVVAAAVDPVRGFERRWEAAIVGMKQAIPMNLIARSEGGYTDEINGLQAAWVPGDAYIVEIEDNILAMQYPANRQAISRWAGVHSRRHPLEASDFLLTAASYTGKGAQIVLALDAVDVAQPHRIHARLNESEVVKNRKLDVEKLTAMIRGLQGVTLKVSITDSINATIDIDFESQLSLNRRDAKELFLSILDEAGASLPDVDKFTCTVTSRRISLTGRMSVDALRRVLSLLEMPASRFSSQNEYASEDSSESSRAEQVVKNSQAYFKSVQSMLDDLRKHTKTARGGSDAVWNERYATRIDRLPILYVDVDLLDYGGNVSQTLRTMSLARRQSGLRQGIRKANVVTENVDGTSSGPGGAHVSAYGYGGAGIGYGYSYTDAGYYRASGAISPTYQATANAIAENNAKMAASRAAGNQKVRIARQEQNQATATREQGWKLIADGTAAIRRAMTERYSVEF